MARLESQKAPSVSWATKPWDAVKLLARDLGFHVLDGGYRRGGSISLPRGRKATRGAARIGAADLETLRVENDWLVETCRDYVVALGRAGNALGLDGFVVLSECSGVVLEMAPLHTPDNGALDSPVATGPVPGTVLSLAAAGPNPVGLALDQAGVAVFAPSRNVSRRSPFLSCGLGVPLGQSPVPAGCLGLLVAPILSVVAPAMLGQALFSARAMDVALALRKERSANLEAAAGLAHEVKNPLTAVKGFLQLTLANCGEVPDYSRLALSELDRAISLLDDYSLFIRAPRITPTQPVKVDAIMAEAALLARGMVASGPAVTIAYVDSDPDLMVLADLARLKQVLLNLCRNAVEAMPEGGLLTLRTRSALAEVVMVVSDTGMGMTPDVLEKVFEPFYTTKPSGTGLGLAVCRRIVEAHGGQLLLTSQPGRGTAVEVRLPRHFG